MPQYRSADFNIFTPTSLSCQPFWSLCTFRVNYRLNKLPIFPSHFKELGRCFSSNLLLRVVSADRKKQMRFLKNHIFLVFHFFRFVCSAAGAVWAGMIGLGVELVMMMTMMVRVMMMTMMMLMTMIVMMMTMTSLYAVRPVQVGQND